MDTPFVNQTYRDGEFKVVSKEDMQAIFYAIKEGRECDSVISIVVYFENTPIAQYSKEFDQEVTQHRFASFMRNFLECPLFRMEYVVDGYWDGVMTYRTDKGVNKMCGEHINRLNKKKERSLQFRDFVNLRTHGRDVFSAKKEPDLLPFIGDDDLEKAQTEFPDAKDRLSCLRWIARGLRYELAVRKVKCDIQIRNNVKEAAR